MAAGSGYNARPFMQLVRHSAHVDGSMVIAAGLGCYGRHFVPQVRCYIQVDGAMSLAPWDTMRQWRWISCSTQVDGAITMAAGLGYSEVMVVTADVLVFIVMALLVILFVVFFAVLVMPKF